jgi:uncharacterized protein (UPF0264 family)
MARLLVSVRSAVEVEAVLSGGADLIDVKEPVHGSLGRASAAVVDAVCRQVGGRRPVSAALGEFRDRSADDPPSGLAFVKWGLSGCLKHARWQDELAAAFDHVRRLRPGCLPVAVAYADWQPAESPPPAEVCAFACAYRTAAFLVDTWRKDGRTLLDWLSVVEVGQLRERCRAAGVRVALAGSLDRVQIGRLRAVDPDWFAVRGAVCREACRTSIIDVERVRALAEYVHSLTPAATRGG